MVAQYTGPRRIPTAGGTLFHVAAKHLGSARQWTRIAASNGLEDPWLADSATLVVPYRHQRADNSGILWPDYAMARPPEAPLPMPAPDPVARTFRFDQTGAGFRFDATGPDAPTFDQTGVTLPPGGGSGGGGPTDPPPPPPPPPAKVDFSMETIGPTFDRTTGPSFDET